VPPCCARSGYLLSIKPWTASNQAKARLRNFFMSRKESEFHAKRILGWSASNPVINLMDLIGKPITPIFYSI
jgi:hypothetical protein